MYGKSIKLDVHNDFQFDKTTNSLLVSNEEVNVEQALKILLGTIKGELRLYDEFGVDYPSLLKRDISDDNIKHAIKSAVIRDPRVKTVENVVIEKDGRTLKLHVVITTNKNAVLEVSKDVIW